MNKTMTPIEAKATIEFFYNQILNELWLTKAQKDGLANALDFAIHAIETIQKQNLENLKNSIDICNQL